MLEILPILLIACITVLFIMTVGAIFYLAYMGRAPVIAVVLGLIAVLMHISALSLFNQAVKPDQSTEATNESTIKYTN